MLPLIIKCRYKIFLAKKFGKFLYFSALLNVNEMLWLINFSILMDLNIQKGEKNE
jgi:hypothetical protein